MKRLSHAIAVAICILILQNRVEASHNRSAKLGKLRGHRSSKDSKANPPATARELTSMWENTQAEQHIIHNFVTYNTDGEHGPPSQARVQESDEKARNADEKVVVDVVDDGELVEQDEMENASADEPVHMVNKEEPKGLYVGGKSSKPKNKAKSGKTKETEEKNADSKTLQVKDYEAEEEALKNQAVDRKPEETATTNDEKSEEKKPPKESGSAGRSSSTAKESSKGKEEDTVMEPQEIVDPKIVEIRVGFQYQLDTEDKAEMEDFGELAKSTSHVCDYIFRHYFMDIEEVQFLSTDRLAIYEISGPNYVVFTVAAYFDGAASIPTAQDLTSIVTSNLLSGSTYYDYYMFLLQELPETNAFHFVNKIELYSQTSKLTGPNESASEPMQVSGRLFKVVVPIVVLMLVSVVAALVYISWVESQELYDEDDEEDPLHPPEVRKVIAKNDCERTVPSQGDSSLTDQHYYSDDLESMSESSAHFVDEMVPPTPTKAKKVRVSPRVLYRSFNPGEISSRVDFEEVSLYDEEEKPPQTKGHAIRKKLEPEVRGEGEASMLKLMDDFAQALAMSPTSRSRGARKDPEASTAAPYWDNDREVLETDHKDGDNDLLLAERTISVDASLDNDDEVVTFSDVPKGAEKVPTDVCKNTEAADLSPQPTPNTSPKPSPKVSPKTVLRTMNQALQRVNRLRKRETSTDGDETKSFFEEEYEEEVLEDESVYEEEEVSVYEEEEVEEEEEEKELDAAADTDSKTSTDSDLAAIEDALWGPQPAESSRQEVRGLSKDQVEEALSQEPLTPVPNQNSIAANSPRPTPPMPPKQARAFWENKSAQQGTIRDFWEQKSKPKQNKK